VDVAHMDHRSEMEEFDHAWVKVLGFVKIVHVMEVLTLNPVFLLLLNGN
jgi:hypothetical protein